MFLMFTQATAQTAADEFEQGNALYRDGKFEKAIVSYENVLREGVASSSLYFNLGNAYYRLGRTAPTILAYERALRLDPNDPDIKHNLELVNLKTVDRIEPLPELFFIQWIRSLSAVFPLHTMTRLTIALWVIFFGSLAAFYFFSKEIVLRSTRWVALISVIFLIFSALLLTTQFFEWRSRDEAIVTQSVVTAKTSPDTQGADAFVVHEGLKVKLSDSVGEWVKITLADGKVGWIRSQECERI